MLYLILDNIRSLHNVGSLFRSCDGFGVDKILLSGYTGIPPRKEISKTALGAEEVVLWEKHDDTEKLIKFLKKEGFYIVSLEKSETSETIDLFKWPEKTVLILGNEITGIDKKILDISDFVVHINMDGIKESFNVASAGAIALFDWRSKKIKLSKILRP